MWDSLQLYSLISTFFTSFSWFRAHLFTYFCGLNVRTDDYSINYLSLQLPCINYTHTHLPASIINPICRITNHNHILHVEDSSDNKFSCKKSECSKVHLRFSVFGNMQKCLFDALYNFARYTFSSVWINPHFYLNHCFHLSVCVYNNDEEYNEVLYDRMKFGYFILMG